jgi:hypothetical protein
MFSNADVNTPAQDCVVRKVCISAIGHRARLILLGVHMSRERADGPSQAYGHVQLSMLTHPARVLWYSRRRRCRRPASSSWRRRHRRPRTRHAAAQRPTRPPRPARRPSPPALVPLRTASGLPGQQPCARSAVRFEMPARCVSGSCTFRRS